MGKESVQRGEVDGGMGQDFRDSATFEKIRRGDHLSFVGVIVPKVFNFYDCEKNEITEVSGCVIQYEKFPNVIVTMGSDFVDSLSVQRIGEITGKLLSLIEKESEFLFNLRNVERRIEAAFSAVVEVLEIAGEDEGGINKNCFDQNMKVLNNARLDLVFEIMGCMSALSQMGVLFLSQKNKILFSREVYGDRLEKL